MEGAAMPDDEVYVDAGRAEYYRRAGWWRDGTILDDLRRAVREHPDKTALVCCYTDGRAADKLTYAQLAERVDQVAAAFLELGVGRGDVVTLQLPNSWELIASCLACARIGAIAGPVVPIMRRREVEFMTRLTESPVYVAAAEYRGFSYASMSAEVAKEVPTLRHRVLLGAADRDPGGALDFHRDLLGREDWHRRHPAAELDALEAGPDDPAQVMFTSGTTGEPKGVLHSHNTLYAMNKAQADVLRLMSSEVTAMGSPTTHQGGYTWNFVMPLLLGATSVQLDAWDPDLMLQVMEREGVTFFMGAPTFMADLVAAQRRDGRDLSKLAVFATGSAPVAPVVVERARETLGCRVYALWGMTENGCVTVTRPEDSEMRASESDGTPIPGMEVRIADRETGQPVPDGGTGLLQVRGATQCLGYHRRPELYAASLTEDGWFDTGDLARADGHGGIRIAGRAKDVISRGGENIPVAEVEAALLRHPSVRDLAIVGYPDERLGERACAVLIPEGAPPSLEELTAHLDEMGMAKPYWPERVRIVTELPKTPSGKIQKFLLRGQLQSD
jgi:cyclohexanecarboxylate-CoA ligase